VTNAEEMTVEFLIPGELPSLQPMFPVIRGLLRDTACRPILPAAAEALTAADGRRQSLMSLQEAASNGLSCSGAIPWGLGAVPL
jgi:hypothetical protein